jgi:mono/diheme cytochrome c family protein
MSTGEDPLISRLHNRLTLVVLCTVGAALALIPAISAQSSAFHNAPATASQQKNPFSGDALAAAGGKKAYSQNCAQCHGNNLQGMGPAPTLMSANVKNAAPGDLFWFITHGDLNKGMPGWPQLTKQQRWQLVTFLESKNAAK